MMRRRLQQIAWLCALTGAGWNLACLPVNDDCAHANTCAGQGGGPSVCGDEQVTGEELCDDGNSIDGDGCDSDCQPSGRLRWATVLDFRSGPGDAATAVAPLDGGDGGFVVVGHTRALSNPAAQDRTFATVTATGEIGLTQTFDGLGDNETPESTDDALHVAAWPDGGFVVVGHAHVEASMGVAESAEYPVVTRYTSDGVEVWSLALANVIRGRANAVVVDDMGFVWVGGSQGTAAWLRKFNGNTGDILRTITPALDGSTCNECDRVVALAAVPQVGIAVAATLRGANDDDVWVAQVDYPGNEVWSDTYDTGGPDTAIGVGVDETGSVIVLGSSTASAFVRKYAPNGDLAAQIDNPTGAASIPTGFAVAPDGGFATTLSSSVGGETNIIVQRHGPDGSVIWATPWGDDALRETALGHALALTSAGEVAVVGQIHDPVANDSDAFIALFAR